MTFVQVCLLVTMLLNIAALIVAKRKGNPPSRWTDVSAAAAILCVILYAAGVR